MKKCRLIYSCLVLCFLFVLTNVLIAQDPPQYGTPFSEVPDTRDINLYQVHLRPYSEEGKLDGVTDRLDNITELGINVIYLMPVFPTGETPPSSVSPYCIRDFKTVGTEYGTLKDLRELVDGAHERGMAVMLDFVVNQTSWDHPWIKEHPDWYMVDEAGKPNALYPDVAELNTENPDTRAALIDAMRNWIFAANIDGYRCDYANKATIDFWTEVISNLRSISTHDLLFLAEGDRQDHFKAGFDMTFGDRWYWEGIKKIAENDSSNVAEILDYVNDYEYLYASNSNQVARYTGNHDTYTNDNGTHRPFVVFNNHDGVIANFLVSAYMKGVPFLMGGQEIDYSPMTSWPWTDFKFDWNQNPTAQDDFKKILLLRAKSAAIRRGELENFSNADVCVFTKTKGLEVILTIVNLRNLESEYAVPEEFQNQKWEDAFTGKKVTMGNDLHLKAYEYRVYKKYIAGETSK